LNQMHRLRNPFSSTTLSFRKDNHHYFKTPFTGTFRGQVPLFALNWKTQNQMLGNVFGRNNSIFNDKIRNLNPVSLSDGGTMVWSKSGTTLFFIILSDYMAILSLLLLFPLMCFGEEDWSKSFYNFFSTEEKTNVKDQNSLKKKFNNWFYGTETPPQEKPNMVKDFLKKMAEPEMTEEERKQMIEKLKSKQPSQTTKRLLFVWMSFLVTSLTIGSFLYCKNQAIRIAILKQNILQINRFSFRGIPKVEELSVSDLEFGKSKLWWLVTSRTNPKQFYRLDKEGTIHDKILFDRIFIQRASSDPTISF